MKIGKDFREILFAEIISVTGGLIGGLLLSNYLGKLELIAGLFILIPGFLEMRGNILGTLSARVSSGLILGVLKPVYKLNKILKGNISAAFLLSIITSIILGIMALGFSQFLFGVGTIRIIYLALIAGVLASVIEIPLTISFDFWLFKHGLDPNNIMGPYVTTLGDVISIVSLLIALVIV